jgi:hypothetical protein
MSALAAGRIFVGVVSLVGVAAGWSRGHWRKFWLL